MTLPDLLRTAARLRPDHVAVEEPPASRVSFRELDALSDRVRDRLRDLGVGSGERVGLCLRKSIDAVAAIFGTLKAGAAYVPVDAEAPAERAAYILNDCGVKVLFLEGGRAERILAELARLRAAPQVIVVSDVRGGDGLRAALEGPRAAGRPRHTDPPRDPQPDDLAYILYTSGSTGKPKGVMLSHRNALSFVDWCSKVFAPRTEDRFSSHAPFHFDLSILDLYVPVKHAATVILIEADLGKEPTGLAELIAQRRLTMWYSTPSILSLLVQYGKLERHDLSSLRLILFAGEVFPTKHLRAVKARIPHPRYFNLYGPTETNVCTYYEIPAEIPADRAEPYPIGKVCSHYAARVVDEHLHEVPRGTEGELCISGPGVMQGYWNLPEHTAHAFLTDPDRRRWYRTGDIVREDAEGDYLFLGRRDRMVKRRGYRIELGEIEAGLYRHPRVKEAAVIARPDVDAGVRIKAVLCVREGAPPSLIELKRFCAETLPAWMIPDEFGFRDTLPKTSTDKVDYQRLLEIG